MKFALPLTRLVVCGLLVFPSISSAQLLFFDSPDQYLAISTFPGTDTETANVTLGGLSVTREFTLTGISSLYPPYSANGDLDGGKLFLSTGSGELANLSLDWLIDDPLGIDLTSFGDEFQFRHIFNDGVPGSSVELTVWNGATQYSSGAIPLSNTGFSLPTSYTYDVDFSDFTGADFSAITRVQFKIVGATSVDLTLDNFQVVPEPSAALLAGLAGSFALVRRRRAC